MRKLIGIALVLFISGAGYAKEVIMDNVYYSWVDKLNIREAPGMNSKVTYQLAEGEEVSFLGTVTSYTTNIILRNIEFDAPWALVKTSAGIEGWVYAGGLKKTGDLTVIADQADILIDPDSSSMVLARCKKGDILHDMGYRSDYPIEIKITGKTEKCSYIMVQTPDGYKGWVPEAYLKNSPPVKPDIKPNSVIVSSYTELTNAARDEMSNRTIFIKEGTYYIPQSISLFLCKNVEIIGIGKVELISRDSKYDILNIQQCDYISRAVLKTMILRNSLSIRKNLFFTTLPNQKITD